MAAKLPETSVMAPVVVDLKDRRSAHYSLRMIEADDPQRILSRIHRLDPGYLLSFYHIDPISIGWKGQLQPVRHTHLLLGGYIS